VPEVRQGLANSLLLAVGGATAAALLTLVTMLEMWQEARFSNVAVLALTVVAIAVVVVVLVQRLAGSASFGGE
jgi:hypothetical protein